MNIRNSNIKNRVPWQMKLIVKVLFSRFPLEYSFWRKMRLFKHGRMEQPEYAFNVVKRHFAQFVRRREGDECVVLELGPGDSLFSAIIASAFGASSTYLIDVAHFASLEIERYMAMGDCLKEKGFALPHVGNISSINDFLELCHAKYLTTGISSFLNIADQSVDFIWSEAVLEHLKLSEFSTVLHELRRILRPDGVSSHRIDLRDHLSGGLNNLRFPERIWEAETMAKSGFYTNRIRYPQMLSLFGEAGFDVTPIIIESWNKLPIPRKRLSVNFRDFSDEELQVAVFDVLLKPKR